MAGLFQKGWLHWRFLLVYSVMMNTKTPLTDKVKVSILSTMLKIRMVEEAIAEQYKNQKMRCPTHLSIGQEAPPSILSALLTHDDQVVSTHRAHAHYLAKGGNLNAFIAELHGKASGCSGGMGGSMHLIDKAVGFMGSTAIVGGTIPIGVGLALAKQIKQERGLVVIYIGDGAIEEGVFYEAANFSVVRNLPVLFVCENNRYSVYSSLDCRQPQDRKIYELAASIGLQSWHGDGNDISNTFQLCSDAVEHIKLNNGPAFIELDTYRWREHCGPNYDDHLEYRPAEEIAYWKSKDPIKLLTKQLLDSQVIDVSVLNTIKNNINKDVLIAFEKAELAPFPASNTPENLTYA